MRYVPECPNGVMDFLLLNLLEWGRVHGYTTFNLGMAPLATVGEAREAHRRERLARLLFDQGETVYNFRGLRLFKDKYDPIWVPRYLAYPSVWEWPFVVAHITVLISGGWARGFGRVSRRASKRENELRDLHAVSS